MFVRLPPHLKELHSFFRIIRKKEMRSLYATSISLNIAIIKAYLLLLLIVCVYLIIGVKFKLRLTC